MCSTLQADEHDLTPNKPPCSGGNADVFPVHEHPLLIKFSINEENGVSFFWNARKVN